MRRHLFSIVFLLIPLLAIADTESHSSGKPVLRAMQFTVPAQGDRVNINTADEKELSERLKGVGEKKARAIVDYRKANGPFRSLRQLENVKGIGPALVQKNRHMMMLQ